ncbi:unnamed protein product [Sympodiomycopsis kandeliae]
MPGLVRAEPKNPPKTNMAACKSAQSLPAFERYTPLTFPNLCDFSRAKSARIEATRSIELAQGRLGEDGGVALARAAFARLVMAYAEVDDIVLNELNFESGSSTGNHHVRFLRLQNPGRVTNKVVVEQLARDSNAGPILQAPCPFGSGIASFIAGHCSPATWFPSSGIALEAKHDFKEGLQLRMVADASHCSEPAAANMLEQLDAIIVGMVSYPEACFLSEGIPSISFGSHQDSPALQSIFEAQHDRSRATLPIQWLAEQGRSRPHAVAHELYATGTSPKQTLTYGELDVKSNQMARWLQKKANVGEGSRVAVCRERDYGFYVSMAAILKAGGCYVPIDVDLPPERKRYIASDSSAALVLCRSGDETLFGSSTQQVDSREIWDEITQASSQPLDLNTSLDSLSYLQYTSGTTGTPKGCKLTHRGLFWAITAMVEMPSRITNPDTDKRLAMAAVAFDVHVSEIVQSWALGTRLVSVRSRLELISNLQQYIEDFQITHIGMVPSMIESCLIKGPEELPLKYMVSGGDKLSDEVLSKWAANPQLLFAQFYGPSECHIGCLARQMRGVMDRKDNIGLPFPGSAAYVVNSNLNIVPRGVPGELVVEGDLVGAGYLGLAEATKKNFIPFPRPECRAYRTGDLVRMNHDGSILISGRVDSQIKLRGVRIESEGVSNVIRQASQNLPLEAVTAIATHPETGGAEILVTFVAPQGVYTAVQRRDDPVLSELPDQLSAQLRQAAEDELASYMRPGHIVPVKFLPLSHNGKVDVKMLLQLFKQSSMQELQAVQKLTYAMEPAVQSANEAISPTEETIIDLVSALIGIPTRQLRPSRRLFEIGLSSLQFARLTAQINKRLNVSLSVPGVMMAATIQGVAALADADLRVEDSAHSHLDLQAFHDQNIDKAREIFRADDIEAVLPALPVQPGVLAQVFQAQSGAYVQHFLYSVGSEGRSISHQALLSAVAEVTRAHQILRTVFLADEAELLQVVLNQDTASNTVKRHEIPEDWVTFPTYFHEHAAESIASRINEDVTTPMWEVGLFSHVQDENVMYLSLSLSHVVYDAFATSALMRHLDAALAGHSTTTSPTLQSVLQAIGKVGAEDHRQFWKTLITPALPSLRKRPAKHLSGTHATRQKRLLDLPLSDVRSQCSKVGITTEAFFDAVLALAGRQILSWDGYAVFGTVQSGRSIGIDNIDSTVLPLVTVFPVVLNISGSDNGSILGQAHKTLLESAPHSHFPLGQIQSSINQRSLFDVLFSCREVSAKSGYEHFTHIESSATTLEFPLAIEVLFNVPADTIEIKSASSDQEYSSEVVFSLLESLERISTELSAQEDLNASFISSDAAKAESNGTNSQSDSPQEAHIPADPEVVATICAVACAFLKLAEGKVGPDTSLVSLGVTSLSAVALAMRCQEAGISVDAIAILQNDRPRRIAARVQSVEKWDSDDALSTDGQASNVERQLLAELESSDLSYGAQDNSSISMATPLQEGMLSQTVASEGQSYIHAFPVTLAAGVEIEHLKQAWSQAAASFDILRTTFHFAPDLGKWAAAVHKAVQLQWVDIASDEPADVLSKRAVSMLGLKESKDFSHRPPWLLVCVQRPATHNASQERILIVAAHHAEYDGASMHSLMQHVSTLYAGQSVPLAATASFQTFARQVSSHVESNVAYWTKLLRSTPELGRKYMAPLPLDEHTNKAWRASLSLDNTLAEDLTRFCRRYRITTQSVAQVALAKSITLWTGLRDIVFCQVVGGRTGKGTGSLVGPCFNTIPCRINLTNLSSARESVKAVHQTNLSALPHQHAPLRLIQQACRVQSISDVLFVFQPKLDDDVESNGAGKLWKAVPRSSEVHETTTHFALNVEVWERKDGLEIKSSASVGCMPTREELIEFLDLYAQSLSEIVYAPADSILPAEWVAKYPAASTVQQGEQGSHSEEASSLSIDDETLEQNEAVRAVRDALCRTTKLDPSKITMSSGLASLGLDSIAAIQVASHARRAGVQLAPADIVRSPTVRALYILVLKQQTLLSKSTVDETSIPLAKRDPAQLPEALLRKAEAKLLPSLKGKVSAWKPTPGMETVFNSWQSLNGHFAQMVLIRQAASTIDSTRLVKSWNDLVRRHETLRSTMVPLSSLDNDRCAFVIVDDAHWTPYYREEEFDSSFTKGDEVATSVARKLLLSPPAVHSPPSTLVAVKSKGAITHVVLYLPHWQYDGWSLGPVMKDLEALYRGEPATANNDLRGLLQACSTCQGDEGLEAEYWRGELPADKDLSAALLRPRQRVKETVKQGPAVTSYLSLDSGDMPLMSTMNDVALAADITLGTLFFATWALIQSGSQSKGSQNRSDACFSVVQHGRNLDLDNIANLAAITLNLVPLYATLKDISNQHTIDITAILQVAKQIQASLNQRPPSADQCRWREISRWTGRNPRDPLSNVVLNVQHFVSKGKQTASETTAANGEDSAPAGPLWKPLVVPFRLSAAEQRSNQHGWEHLGKPSPTSLSFEEMSHSILRIGIRSNSETGRLVLHAEYNPDAIAHEEIQELMEGWKALCAKLVSA